MLTFCTDTQDVHRHTGSVSCKWQWVTSSFWRSRIWAYMSVQWMAPAGTTYSTDLWLSVNSICKIRHAKQPILSNSTLGLSWARWQWAFIVTSKAAYNTDKDRSPVLTLKEEQTTAYAARQQCLTHTEENPSTATCTSETKGLWMPLWVELL